MGEKYKISVIIVTFNSQRTIKACLDSVVKSSGDCEIIVVDNGSSDETCSSVRSFGKKVNLIETGENLGFAKANNLGVWRSSGEYLIFLNPDTKVLKAGDLIKLIDVLEKNSGYAVIGPRLIYPGGQIQPRVRNLPTVKQAFREYILGQKGAYDFYLPNKEGLSQVESIIGACMVIKKDLFERIGGFNGKYFMYYEDLELCKKVGELGQKVGYYPEVTIEHAEGASGLNQKTYQFLQDSAKKYHGLASFYLIQLILRLSRVAKH